MIRIARGPWARGAAPRWPAVSLRRGCAILRPEWRLVIDLPGGWIALYIAI